MDIAFKADTRFERFTLQFYKIALGLAPLFLGPVAYQMLGIGYLGNAMASAFSIVFDKSAAQSNFISRAIEVVLGVILVI